MTDAPAGDRLLVETWAAGQASPRTRISYRHQGVRLLGHLGKPMAEVTVADLQAYISSLGDLAPATIGLAVASLRALWAFGIKTGVLANDPTSTLQAPPIKNVLAERILDEADVRRLIDGEPNPRNRALLALFYGAGLRRSELAGLTWRDIADRGSDRGQATVFGKGGKTRTVMLYGQAWALLAGIRADAVADAPVFVSRKGGHLDPSAVWRIVKTAAARAGLPDGTSPHWLRHSHASHSLDRGAPLSLVQQGLGHASVATTSKYLHARPSDGAGRYLGV
ncbi:MAG: tyrosine-type recombinase/integrase [Janthinobacterium lividum]